MQIFYFLIVVAVIFMIVAGIKAEKKRQEALMQWAENLGLRYTPGKDSHFDNQYPDFPFMNQGSNKYLNHRMSGRLKGNDVLIGEYHYQTTTHNGKNTTTHHFFSTLVMLKPRFVLQDLSIRKEGLFDRFKAAFGWDDIDFASAEFSRKFHVSAPNRDFAFTFIQPATMDMLLTGPNVEVHLRHGWLLVRKNEKLNLSNLPLLLQFTSDLLDPVPDFAKEIL
jgi:hypothetical protein